MITKKLAVPLINEKILAQAEHCYIATAAISDAGFDLIRSRIPPKCKMDIVTGLDDLTSPNVLKRIYSHYQGRITLNIYTRNALHANVYIFYLPFRKAVGFLGSGAFSLEGLKDHEELFWKVTDAKEIESLMSWFTSYYEFSSPLTEQMIQEYELIYPTMKQREIDSLKEKRDLKASTASGFNLETVKFKSQFFKKEDYEVLSERSAAYDNASIRLARMELQNKLNQLHQLVSAQVDAMKLNMANTVNEISTVELKDHPHQKVKGMWVSGRKNNSALSADYAVLNYGLTYLGFSIHLSMLGRECSASERNYFLDQVQVDAYRAALFAALLKLESYTIEIAGIVKSVKSFANDQLLLEFIKIDQGMHFGIKLEKTFSPGDTGISVDAIPTTVAKELQTLSTILELV